MNFTALLRTSVLAVAVCLVAVSCGNENKNNNTAPTGGYSDASGTVSGEFVFPGEASNTTENNNVPKDTEAVTAEDIAEFLSEYTDISKYRRRFLLRKEKNEFYSFSSHIGTCRGGLPCYGFLRQRKQE